MSVGKATYSFSKVASLVVACLFSFSAFSQDATFTAKAPSSVAVGQKFEIKFTTNASNVSSFKGPALDGFSVLSGPNQSRSVQIINGSMTSEVSLSYVLVAQKEGTFTIPPAKVMADGETLLSNEVTITVTKGSNNSSSSGGGSSNSGSAQSSSGTDYSKHLFLSTASSKRTVYVGEHLTSTYKLYNRVRFTGSSVEKMPSLNGFWSQDVKSPFEQVQWTTEYANGLNYEVAELKKTVLFAQRSGELILDPLEMTFDVQLQSRNFFDNFFGRTQTEKVTIKSAPVKIKVLPLPEKGKPEDFNGAVGNFNFSAEIDKNKVKTNDAINLKVRITGTGNLKLIEQPVITFPSDFEVYDPKINEDIKVTASGVSGYREYEYLIIPRRAGDFTIDPLTFSYFDPSKKQYISHQSGTFEIKVEKNPNASASGVVTSLADKEDIKVLNEDIRYIIPAFTLQSAGSNLIESWWFYLLLLVPAALFLIAFMLRNTIRENLTNTELISYKKASQLANKHLKTAKKELEAGNKTEFYNSLITAIYGYVADKLKIKNASLTKENLRETLASKNISENNIQQFLQIIDTCEMARYAPVAGSNEQELLSKTEQTIKSIENEI
jgi:hypothetical protein